MKTFLSLLTFLACTSFAFAQVVEYTYDFNDLDEGNLNGQDSWSVVVNAGGSPAEMDVAYVYTGPGGSPVPSYDGTKAAFYGQSCGNCGRTGSRPSTTSFPWDFTIGGVIEIEVDIHTAWWGTLFGFGHDDNNNGFLMPCVETVVNIEDNEGGVGFHVANHPDVRYFYLPDGSTVEYTYPLDESSGWHSYKMFIDLDANDGAGSITFFVKEMTGDWVPVNEIQDLNLGMTPGSGTSTDPATWTRLFIHGTGLTSGFDNIIIRQPDTGGLLYQYITFNPLPNHLTTDNPFTLQASSSQGLEVSFEIDEGPATLNGNQVTLTGEPGTVIITATQQGNDTVAAADPVTQSFDVIDPATVVPVLEIRNPVDGEVVRDPDLIAIQFIVSSEIEHPDLLHIQNVQFAIDGNTINGYETNNGFFMGNWTPPDFGTYTVDVTATSSGGPSISESVTFEVVSNASGMEYSILDAYNFPGNQSIDTTLVLPSFAGTYSNVTAVLNYGCPCEPWDVNAHVRVRGANGEWMELFKYITPYGVACDDQVDVTDFVSQLQGKVDFNISFPESITTLTLNYTEGTPDYHFSWIDNLWQDSYPFGDIENLQPVEPHLLNFGSGIEKAHIRLMCSGHSWGDNNTGNAAEFYEATHGIKLNGNVEFDQHLWQTCNPNPVGCQPQNGTWYFDRHGWCPGTIPMLWLYDLTDWITQPDLELEYEFYPDYVDLCHPNQPDCVSGVTCPDCNSTYNPVIRVAGGLVTYSNEVIFTSIKETVPFSELRIKIAPNPSNGMFTLSTSGKRTFVEASVHVSNLTGELMNEFYWNSDEIDIDLSGYSAGIYLLSVTTDEGIKTEKLIIQ